MFVHVIRDVIFIQHTWAVFRAFKNIQVNDGNVNLLGPWLHIPTLKGLRVFVENLCLWRFCVCLWLFCVFLCVFVEVLCHFCVFLGSICMDL